MTVKIPMLPNFRDLGGHRTMDGARVRTQMVYRSVDLSHLDQAGTADLTRLGLRTVYDLRTEAERSAKSDRTPPGAEHIALDVLADEQGAAPAQVSALLDNPREAEVLLGDGKSEELFKGAYRAIVSLDSARNAYRKLYTGLARPERRPALFHCTTGKDRTGWGAAALLLLLEVSDDDVMADYLRTNDDLLPALQPVFDEFRAAGGDPSLLTPVLGVREEYLNAALDEVHARYGTIEAYFANGLGIGDDGQQALRSALLDAAD